MADVDLFEINEAFAAVGIASMDDLGITDDVVNVNGGAIALGHPIGMSGNRLALTLLHELRRRGGGVGAVALCGGGGQGDALAPQDARSRLRSRRRTPRVTCFARERLDGLEVSPERPHEGLGRAVAQGPVLPSRLVEEDAALEILVELDGRARSRARDRTRRR